MAAKSKTKNKAIKRSKSSPKKVVRKEPKVEKMVISPRSTTKKLKYYGKSKYIILTIFIILLCAVLYLSKGIFLAAVVNGKPIWRLSVVKDAEKQAGAQSLDNLIMKSLVEQEAQQKGIKVTSQEIQDEINSLSQAMEAQGTTLESALMSQGITQDELEENMRLKRIVDKLFEDDVDLNEENLQSFYNDNVSYYGEDTNFDDLKDTVTSDYKNQQISQKFQEWAASIKDESSIKYFVSY